MEIITSAAIYHWKLIAVSDFKKRNYPASHLEELSCFILKRNTLSPVVTKVAHSFQFCKKIQAHLNF